LIICIGEAQPSIPEEAYRLARCVVSVSKRFKVKCIYTMAALQGDFSGLPKVYGVYTDDKLKNILLGQNICILNGEGVIKGLNGILIGLAKNNNIEGICLMGEIKYANVPQHLSSKVVLDKLLAILGIEIDTQPLEKRAERLNESIRQKLTTYQEHEGIYRKDEKNFRYIS
jgi:proteasome assembly chaperone (PAC2) family protein